MKALFDKVLQALEAKAAVKGPDRNGNYQTLCPFHDETRPSFSLHQEKGYKCFACNAKGGVRALAERLGLQTGPLTVEQIAEAKGIPLNWLIENKIARQGKNGIEIPYLDEQGNEATIRTRLNLCKLKSDNRFLWERGKPLMPYGLQHLVHQNIAGYTILVEGESDCWTLWLNGFNAIGIPGARNWKRSWIKYLEKFPKVYVWLEPDEAGRAFLSDLVADFPSIFVIEGPGGVKDPNDLYLSDTTGFKNAITQAMEEAKPGKDVLAALGQVYDMSWQGKAGRWKWDSDGLHVFNQQGKDFVVLSLKLRPLEILITPEGRRYCHIMIQTGGRVCELYLADSWVGMRSSDAAKEVADYGVALTTKQVQTFQEFIGELLNEATLPNKTAYSKLGWYDEYLYAPGLNNAIYLPTPGLDWLKHYGSAAEAGEAEAQKAWRYIMEVALAEAPSLLAAIGAALASPLLSRLPKTEFISFMVHFHTLGTGTGKTTILEASAATLGDPKRICTSWDSTKVGLEQMLGPLRHFPLFLNELGDCKYGVPEDAVMMLTEEIGRRRGTSSGGLRPTAEWRTIVLSTGNSPIAPGSAHHARRVVSVPVALPHEDFAKECQEVSHNFYGFPFRWCIPLYQTSSIEMIRSLAYCYGQLYVAETLPLKPQAFCWAILEIGARMMLSCLGLDENAAHKSLMGVAAASAERRQLENMDYVSRVVQLVEEDVAKDPGAYSFGGMSKQRALRGMAGRILEEEETEEGGIKVVAVLPGRLQELTRNANIPDLPGALIEAKNRGILITSPERTRLSKKVRVGESPAWCYVFDLAKQNALSGNAVGTTVGTKIEAILGACSHTSSLFPLFPLKK